METSNRSFLCVVKSTFSDFEGGLMSNSVGQLFKAFIASEIVN